MSSVVVSGAALKTTATELVGGRQSNDSDQNRRFGFESKRFHGVHPHSQTEEESAEQILCDDGRRVLDQKKKR